MPSRKENNMTMNAIFINIIKSCEGDSKNTFTVFQDQPHSLLVLIPLIFGAFFVRLVCNRVNF